MIQKLIKISIPLALAASSTLFAADNTELTKRLEALENEIKSVKAENAELKNSIAAVKSDIKKDMKAELSGQENRIDEIETRVLLNKVVFGLGMQDRVDSFGAKVKNGKDYFVNNDWSSKFYLTMESDITSDMHFDGRLAMYKYWANDMPNSMSFMDSVQGRRPADSRLFVERAYVDWTLNKGSDIPVILTLGRQPSSDGPSHQFKDDTRRKSTYSALAFDGVADGVVATVDLEKSLSMKDAAVRLAYGKGYQNVNQSNQAPNPYLGANYGGTKDTNFYGVFIDGSIPSVKGSLLQVGAVKAVDLKTPYSPLNIGDVTLFGLMGEFTNIYDSGFDAFAHVGFSQAKGNGSSIVLDPRPNMPTFSLLGLNGDNKAKNGTAQWIGARYTLPYAYKGKIGVEYNHGSKNWFSFTQGSYDPTNKLATRGNAYEVYYLHPVNRYASLRLGAQFINYDYTGTGSPLGEPMKIADLPGGMSDTKKLTNFYLLFKLLF